LEMTKQAIESNYYRKLNRDTGLIIGMLALLVGVEGFVLYRILLETWAISGNFFYLYGIFAGLIIVIESIGCLSVRKSIQNHMFEFRYYD